MMTTKPTKLRQVYGTGYREDISLQTLVLLFKGANHWNKEPFLLAADKALVGTKITADVTDIFAISRRSPIQILILTKRT